MKQVVNLLFKEIASEWVDYAMDVLEYSKEDALEELRVENRIQFIKSLSQNYYKHFKNFIFEEVADTFIELIALNSSKDGKSLLINAVINSKYVPNRSILGINSSDQLCKRAKAAKDLKNKKVTELQFKLAEMEEGIHNLELPENKRESLSLVYPSYEKKLHTIREEKLEKFDDSLQRLKRAMVRSLHTS